MRLRGTSKSRQTVTIRNGRLEDARAIGRLVSRTYARFCGDEGTPAAVRRYVERHDPKGRTPAELAERFARATGCAVALCGTRIVGVARWRDNQLFNLFVDRSFQRRGIATRLMRGFERTCLDSGFREATVRSSLYAVSFYEAFGFRKTTGVRNLHGLKVQPMKKRFSGWPCSPATPA